MGWMQKLCEVYDSCIDADQSSENIPLMSVGFILKPCKYHVTLTEKGEFASAEEWAKNTYCAIPSSPQAEGRTGNPAPFPLAEQLEYFLGCGGKNPKYQAYMAQLSDWCERNDAPAPLSALKVYLEKETLLQDLTERACLKVKYGEDGTGADKKSFVIFSVQAHDDMGDDLWTRRDVRESWCRLLEESDCSECQLCYVEGKLLPVLENHPKVQGNAKLVSAKDTEYPFLYKGRFTEDRSAASVSAEASLRAHNALNWLIARQGFRRYGMTAVAWNTNGCPVNVPIADYDNWEPLPQSPEAAEKKVPDTFEAYAKQLKAAAAGQKQKFEALSQNKRANETVIMVLEAATDGRMSVIYYQELPGNDYVENLEHWYSTCCWTLYDFTRHGYGICTPGVRQISRAVMGTEAAAAAEKDNKGDKAATKLMRQLRTRLLGCITDRKPLPLSAVQSAFSRATSPLSFTSGKEKRWSEDTWNEAVAVTCALISKHQTDTQGQTPETPKLNLDCRDRDYLFGRLLAVADMTERAAAEKIASESADTEKKKGRQTNAIRLMRRFCQRPTETWAHVQAALPPYFKRLRESALDYRRWLGQIEQSFEEQQRNDNSPVSFRFLQGYYSQRQAIFSKQTVPSAPQPYTLPTSRDELFGCLLAVADAAELEAVGEERAGATNALRLMSGFSAQPLTGWAKVHNAVLPYFEQLGVGSGNTKKDVEYFQQWLKAIEMSFAPTDRLNPAPLDAAWLHGYYCLWQAVSQQHTLPPRKLPADKIADMPCTREAVYGRLLALENKLERRLLNTEKSEQDNRPSNAMRFMALTARTPDYGWTYLRQRLKPYIGKLRFRSGSEPKQIEQLEQLLSENHWDNNRPLEGGYLNSFYISL